MNPAHPFWGSSLARDDTRHKVGLRTGASPVPDEIMNEHRLRYFDHNATTSVAPEVVEAMLPFFGKQWGNPSSAYAFGRDVARHVDEARARVAALIGAEPREVLFTSCGTESNNTAWNSALMTQPGKRHLVTTAVEHSANLKFAEALQRQGCEVTVLPVYPDGQLDLHLLERAIRPDTALVSVMWANNETGVLFPVAEAAAICRSKGVLCHTDAVQAAGKVPLNVREAATDFLSLSGHKLHAPKGVGVLYVRRRTRFMPYLIGGHQERGRRGGTENVPYIVGLGRAAELALARFDEENRRVRSLRDRLETAVLQAIPGAARNGAAEPRLPNTTNLSFPGVEAEALLMLLDQWGICASGGSACTTGSTEPSHVLTAMGLGAARARGSLRFSLGRDTGEADVDYLLATLPGVIARLQAIAPTSPVKEMTPQR